MENLPIDTKSLPSRIFYSEEEDKVYVGEPGDYKEVGGGGGGGDGLPPSEEGKFLVGGEEDWEKRGITGQDVNITVSSGSRVPYWNAATQAWVSGGVQVANAPSSGTLAARTAGPDIGRLKANPAIETDDLVPLGQLNTILENLELPADQVSYDNTASGLLAETVQEAIDEIAGDYVNAGTNNTTGSGFSLDKLVLRNSDTDKKTTVTKPNYDVEDSNITIPSFGGGTKVMPISVNGVSAGPSGDIIIPLGVEVDKFIGVSLGGSSPSVNIDFAASNPNIVNYEEIEIGIQFLGKPTTTTDFRLTFNSNNSPIYNTSLIENADLTSTYTNQPGFRFKYDSDNGFYTFKVKNHPQIGIPRIITGSGVEFGDSSTYPKMWTLGGGFHSNDNITSLQIYSLDNATNVPNMRVTVKKIF